MDVRRELDLINKHFRRHHYVAGETVMWYEFNPLGTASVNSIYDDVYDEGVPGVGGRSYKTGVIVPILLGSENEDQKRAIPEGRQPVQTMDIFVSVKDMRDAGISTPYEYKQRLNDIYVYDGRYYSVYNYRVRGRLKDDIFILISAQEVFPDQEFINDPGPEAFAIQNLPWPASLPSLG
jgi:hypothetical protein